MDERALGWCKKFIPFMFRIQNRGLYPLTSE
jgi:hypothetical protein